MGMVWAGAVREGLVAVVVVETGGTNGRACPGTAKLGAI